MIDVINWADRLKNEDVLHESRRTRTFYTQETKEA